MLVTSRETKRWVVPKGWPIGGIKPHASDRHRCGFKADAFGMRRTFSEGGPSAADWHIF